MPVAEESGDARETERDESAVPGRARIRAHAATLFNDGLAAARDRRPREARDLFAACVLWYPNDLEARSALALACWETGDHEAARRHWESALEQRPSDRRARRGLALVAAAGVPVSAGGGLGPADAELGATGAEPGATGAELGATDAELGPADTEPGPPTESVSPAAAKLIATDPPTAPDPALPAPTPALPVQDPDPAPTPTPTPTPEPEPEPAADPTPTDP